MLPPRLGPTALFPTADQAHRGADRPTRLSSRSQRAWQAPEDSTGNITTGNPLTSRSTRTVSTGKKQQDCTPSDATLPQQSQEGRNPLLAILRALQEAPGGPMAPAFPTLGLNAHFPEAFPGDPRQPGAVLPFSEPPSYFQSSAQSTNSFQPTLYDFSSFFLVGLHSLAAQPAP